MIMRRAQLSRHTAHSAQEWVNPLKLSPNLPQVCGLDLEPMVGGGKRGGGKVKSKKRVGLWFPCSYMTRALLSRER